MEVTAGGRDDFDVFHDLYVTTAARDGFTPRPRRYFPQLWDALHTDFSPVPAEGPSRFTTVRGGHEAGGGTGGGSGTGGAKTFLPARFVLTVCRRPMVQRDTK